MRIEQELAFVLHARHWRETSLLVDVLTQQYGRVGLVARGVQSPRKQLMRAALQPLQNIVFDAQRRGELATLRHVETVDIAPRLRGIAIAAGFYINELCVRLLPRDVALMEGYAAYAQARACLGDADVPTAWIVRRFERDLLLACGFGLDFMQDADGDAVEANAMYWLDPLAGPRRWRLNAQSTATPAVQGAVLHAFARDDVLSSEQLNALRIPMRNVILHHLGGQRLRSWDIAKRLNMKPSDYIG